MKECSRLLSAQRYEVLRTVKCGEISSELNVMEFEHQFDEVLSALSLEEVVLRTYHLVMRCRKGLKYFL